MDTTSRRSFPLRRLTWVALAFAAVAGCECEDQVRVAAGDLALSPERLDLGLVPTGGFVERSFEARNRGSAPIVVEAVALSNDLGGTVTLPRVLTRACDEAPRENAVDLAAGSCALIVVRWAPTAPGPIRTFVVVTSDDPTNPKVEAEVIGEALAPRILACALAVDSDQTPEACSGDGGSDTPAPSLLDFGPVPRRTAATRSVRVVNRGESPLRVSAANVAAGAEHFILPPSPFVPVLAPGESADLAVTFVPDASGPFTGQLEIHSDDPHVGTLHIALAGHGTAPLLRACVLAADRTVDPAQCTRFAADPPVLPTIAITPSLLGVESWRVVRLFNDGPAALEVVEIALLTNAASLGFTGLAPRALLAAGAFANVPVTFTPTTEGAATGTLRVTTDDDLHAVIDLPVTASGIAPHLRVCVLDGAGQERPEQCSRLTDSPAFVPELDFGHLPWGARAERTLRFINDGLAPLELARPTLVSSVPDFAFAAAVEPLSLLPGTRRDVAIVFDPKSDGAVSATVEVRTNDAHAAVVYVAVTGFAEAPKLCVEPSGGLDFGTVATGTTGRLSLTVTNCGLVPYALTELTLAEAEPSTLEFAATPIPAVPYVFATGARLDLAVTYTPRAQRLDTATFTVRTASRTVTVPLRGLGGAPTCASAPPVANAGPDQTVLPLAAVTLDGRASSAPRGGLGYSWRLISQPTNGVSGLTGTTSARPTLFAELAGDYVAELVASDSNSCKSAPDTVVIHVVSDKKIHVQLTWAQGFGDVDTHYIGPGGTFFTSGDVYFGNKFPNWGGPNLTADSTTANDPRLDVDDVWGNGPENVNQVQPFDGTYKVWVHYFCSRQCFFGICGSDYGAATATLKVFIDGVLKYTGTRSLNQRDIWEAAEIDVTSGGTSVAVRAVNAASRQSTSSQVCLSW